MIHLSDSEWRVMDAVWKCHPRPATVREVHEALRDESGWAYSTVKTMLARLVEKGALDVTREGKASSFTPRLTRESARRGAVSTLLERAFDGTVGSMLQFVLGSRRLSAKERAELKELLDEPRDARDRSRRPR